MSACERRAVFARSREVFFLPHYFFFFPPSLELFGATRAGQDVPELVCRKAVIVELRRFHGCRRVLLVRSTCAFRLHGWVRFKNTCQEDQSSCSCTWTLLYTRAYVHGRVSVYDDVPATLGKWLANVFALSKRNICKTVDLKIDLNEHVMNCDKLTIIGRCLRSEGRYQYKMGRNNVQL